MDAARAQQLLKAVNLEGVVAILLTYASTCDSGAPGAAPSAPRAEADGVSVGSPFDVLTIGRVGGDFCPTTNGSIVEVQHFDKFARGRRHEPGCRGDDPPVVLLGGARTDRADEMFERWQCALALPSVRGLVVGCHLLYPKDDDVSAAVKTAASLL